MGIAEAANRKASGFSKGMTQRLGLAQAACCTNRNCSFSTNPPAGWIPKDAAWFWTSSAKKKARGRTVFLSSHILSDVELRAFAMKYSHDPPRAKCVFSDRLTPFGVESTEWQIEVLGFTPSIQDVIQDVIGDKARILSVNGETAILICQAADKQELLKTLLLAPVEIGTVQRHRAGSLEETYMKYVGRA